MPTLRRKKRRKVVVVEEEEEGGRTPEPGASAAAAAPAVRHEGVFCDGCAQRVADGFSQPIIGVRYASMAGDDHDLCDSCYHSLKKKERRRFVAIEEPEHLRDSSSESDGEADLVEAALGDSSSSDDEGGHALAGDGGGHGFVHGEMAVAKAQRTQAVRVEQVFSSAEIAELLEEHARVRCDCGVVLKKHGEGAQNWSTTFLHTDGIFAATFPNLRKKILDTAAAVDSAEGWHLLDDPPAPPALRCVEIHTVGPGGALPEQKHYDHGSLVTVDIMLSSTTDFQGGQLSTLEPDGILLPHVFERGDATVFVSHKYHCVAPVTAGTRQVLVAEIWAGQERQCAHRCEQHDGDCPVTLGLSRAAAEIEGLQEGAYGHWLNEMCMALQSSNVREREKARDALARLQKLSDYENSAGRGRAKRKRKSETSQAATSSQRSELMLLSNKVLRQRAVAADVDFDDIEEARESSDPKQRLIELIVAQSSLAGTNNGDRGESRAERHAALARKALMTEINNQGAVRENHYDMDGADD